MLLFQGLFLPVQAQVFGHYPEKELDQARLMVVYEKTFRRDSLNPQRSGKENMMLMVGNNASYFVCISFHQHFEEQRKIRTREEYQAWLNVPGRPVSRYIYRIYKGFPKGSMTVVESIPGDLFLYREPLGEMRWSIHPDTTTLNGYTVQKATTDYAGRSWIAWFAPEIPVNDGPYKFNGLPGLILKVHDSRNHYAFEALSLQELQEPTPIIFYERNYIETTRQGLLKAQRYFREDIMSRAAAAGIGGEDLQQIARNISRRNNPIELK